MLGAEIATNQGDVHSGLSCYVTQTNPAIRHGLVVTGTYVDAKDPNTVIVVMDMENMSSATQFATSPELAAARERAGAIGSPDGVWFEPQQIDG